MPPPRIALNACLPPDRLLRVVGELGATLRCLKVSVNAEERDWLKVVTLRDTQFWWARKDLNLGPMDYESTALTAELRARPCRDNNPGGDASYAHFRSRTSLARSKTSAT